MTTSTDAFKAGVAAAIADNSLNKSGFADAIRSVATLGVSDAEAKLWIDELVTLYNSLGIINGTSYASLRNKVIAQGETAAGELLDALGVAVHSLPSSTPIDRSVRKTDLIDERDQVDANIDIIVALKSGQPRQVRDALQLGIEQLRGYKEQVRTQLQSLNQ